MALARPRPTARQDSLRRASNGINEGKRRDDSLGAVAILASPLGHLALATSDRPRVEKPLRGLQSCLGRKRNRNGVRAIDYNLALLGYDLACLVIYLVVFHGAATQPPPGSSRLRTSSGLAVAEMGTGRPAKRSIASSRECPVLASGRAFSHLYLVGQATSTAGYLPWPAALALPCSRTGRRAYLGRRRMPIRERSFPRGERTTIDA